jgi:hypothetical protein
MKIAFDSPHNAKILAHLASNMKPEGLTSMSRSSYQGSYYAWTHPDLSDQFWSLASALETAHWVLYQKAVLVHPETGIVFAFAGGTSTIALRLPPDEQAEAFTDPEYGRKVGYQPEPLNASEFGDDWALVRPFGDDSAVQRWMQAAYDYAGTLA